MLAKAKQKDIKLYEAMSRINFNQDITCLRNMVKALEMMPFMNTAEDNQRLEDTKYYLKNKHKLNR